MRAYLSRLSVLGSMLILLSACTYTMKIQDGNMAVDRKQYAVAEKLLKKEYSKQKSRIEKGKKAFLLGVTYQNLNKSEESIQWFQTAYDNGYGVDALKEVAYGLKKSERYREAIQSFRELGLEIGSPYEYRREIIACQVSMGWQNIKQPEYSVDLMEFNSGAAEYSPTLFKSDQLVFTSDRSGSTGKDTYNWTGKDFSDLYVVDLNSLAVSSFDMNLNTDDNEGTVAFTNDYQEIYFTRCFGSKNQDNYCKIMQSTFKDGQWSIPQEVELFEEENINYGHPALSADGQFLYFSSNHPDGFGGYDIYVCERTNVGWSYPKLLGRTINTVGNEKFPFIDKDTLYFSSDHHPGMGGLDIFRTFKINNGSWGPAFNLKPPLNSGGDDFGYIIDYSEPKKDKDVFHVGYFSSTRLDGIGGDDIYKYEKRYVPPPPPPPKDPEVVVEEEPNRLILEGYILEKIYENPEDPNSIVLGRKPLDAATVDISFGEEEQKITVKDDGFFTIELDLETDYSFTGSKQGYLTRKEFFSTKGIGIDPDIKEQKFEIEIVLDKIFYDKEIVLENIYYDFNKWDIREDAEGTLNELAGNLQLNPDIRIQLGSHTDCRGTDRFNLELAQKRAQSAVDYLIEKGIDSGRLIAKGYGESEPAVGCICSRCSEEEHQTNRRTTFRIIEGFN